MVTSELLGKPNELRGSDLQWTAIPSRKSKNLHATETRVSSNSHELVGSKASPFFSTKEKRGTAPHLLHVQFQNISVLHPTCLQ